MNRPLIYHNPNCSKSRQALALIEERGLVPEVVLYLQNPPGADELDRICTGLAVSPLHLIRVKEDRFAELELSRTDNRTRTEWIRLMVENPVLIERPIVRIGDRYVLARPPERVLELI